MNVRTISTLLFLGALMASAFPLIEVAVPAFGVFPLMAGRLLLAAGLMSVVVAVRGRRSDAKRPLFAWVTLGVLNAALPFALIASAQQVVPSALASMLIATAPSITAALASVRRRKMPRAMQIVGLGVGLGGVALLSGWSYEAIGPQALPAAALLIAAAASYAAGALYTEHRFAGVEGVSVARGSFVAGGLVLLPLALFGLPSEVPASSAWLALGTLVVVSTVGGFLLYFHAIQRHGAEATSLIAYLLPAFGTLYGVTLLGETVGPAGFVGIGVVLMGTAITTWSGRRSLRLGKGATRRDSTPGLVTLGSDTRGTNMTNITMMEQVGTERRRDLELAARYQGGANRFMRRIREWTIARVRRGRGRSCHEQALARAIGRFEGAEPVWRESLFDRSLLVGRAARAVESRDAAGIAYAWVGQFRHVEARARDRDVRSVHRVAEGFLRILDEETEVCVAVRAEV